MGETHIFFIRHGESFDDVSRGRAGSSDSPLTSHGAIQSNRLGAHLAGRAATLGSSPRIFCSDFQQAVITAETIRDAYQSSATGLASPVTRIEIVQLGELREKRFGERNTEASKSAKDQTGGRSYTDREPPEEVNARADRFLNAVLLPLLDDLLASDTPQCVFIVAHAGIHSHVWLQFIRLLRALHVRTGLAPGALRLESVPLDEFLGNAAYHEVVLKLPKLSSVASSSSRPKDASCVSQAVAAAHVNFSAINYTDHLSGLNKTGGGIGNAKFDKKQRKIDSFFSRSQT
ncbi:Histidine phosphatase superfamily [Rhypophila sp. PSN 637]